MKPTLHRRLAATLALISLLAFVSGAGLDAPAVIPAIIILLLAVFVQPGAAAARVLEPVWRILALLLALRAAFVVFMTAADPVLPMVDLLLLLLCAESLREREASGDARHYALTFALLIAAAAYRPGPLFAPLFVLYVAVGTVALVVGHLTREAAVRHLPPPHTDRRFLLRIALMSTVVLAVSGLVFLFFPRVSRGWAARGTPVVARSVIGFSDRVSLGDHGATLESNPEVVMRIEFPLGPPGDRDALHWRGRSYNYFDGVAWSRVDRPPLRPVERTWSGASIEQVVYGRRLGGVNVLFGLHPIVDITAQSRIRPVRLPTGDYAYEGSTEPVYRVWSRAARPHPDSLRSAVTDDSPGIRGYLQLPPVSGRLLALADSFRSSASNTYDHAVAVESWLRTQFDYTLELPRSRREATLDHFLFERRAGHCEYFSTAMAILLRAGGVPARNVNGFLGGEWNDFGGFLTVTQNNAHSWVEVYFPGRGWVQFDPTPAAAIGLAAGGQGRFASLWRLADGLGHRWGKWVLDYDLSTQSSLLDRLSAPFSNAADPARAEPPTQQGRRVWYAAGAAVLLVAFVLALRRLSTARTATHDFASRAYVQLRRAYARSGYPAPPSQPPLAFAASIRDAPGAAAAQEGIALYVQARFGGAPLDEPGRMLLRESVREVKRQLRAAPRR